MKPTPEKLQTKGLQQFYLNQQTTRTQFNQDRLASNQSFFDRLLPEINYQTLKKYGEMSN